MPVLPNSLTNSNLCPAPTSQNIEITNSIWWLQENIWKIIDDASEEILKKDLQGPLDVSNNKILIMLKLHLLIQFINQ